ncbi:FAD-dependent oxidoreductase [Mesobacillus campisalis]|uniref:FAD-dependent oxidoreductase n=1 Tax=Mesobacillus campisalis TaxID=1408103 RepID=A0A0M2T0E7_9BACI|nr:FAD-dependent oxidoreductase [Mesobacillus campisalis]KKK39883.1 FAD-dependent oxidoreductase [Mesobacillus campisalis]
MTASQELHADLVIIGGGLGGCAAALSALQSGKTVILTEETKWIGGQITSQGVPPDEHPWIESFGATRNYRAFRRKVREYYFHHFPVKSSGRINEQFNPGNALVSKISHEPRVALRVLYDMLAPFLHSGKLTLLTEFKISDAETVEDQVLAVTVSHSVTGQSILLRGAYFLDATEMGDVLPAANVEYVIGAESHSDTGEEHALRGEAEPLNMQAFTYCFAVDYIEGEDHTIEKPAQYEFWKNYQAEFWPNKQLSWWGLVPHTLEPIEYSLFQEPNRFSLWTYRRVIDQTNFEPGTFLSDITIVNWPQNDYWLGPIIDVTEEEKQKHIHNAKQLSLSLLYWMQQEAPRPDGGSGYSGLRLRKDVLGTEDGLAMYPYIRESRRIKAEFTVKEQDISGEIAGKDSATYFEDSVGIGCYRLDLHPSTGLDTYIDISAFPFQIPLGSLIPVRVQNLLPASKNIGTTHLTNGCYRLHPVEWNIGEAAGHLAAYCIDQKIRPHEVRNNRQHLKDFQARLVKAGIELEWPQIHKV